MSRDLILARRARFIAASMAALSGEACGSSAPAAHHVAPAASTATVASASASASATPPPPVDTDGDGITDADDACPTISGVSDPEKARHGCPKVVVAVCLSIIVIEQPHFDPGSALPLPDSKAILDATAETMKAHPELLVEVIGHCDVVEKPCPDEKRATAVRDALVSRGVAKDRLLIKAAGRTSPVESNSTAAGRAKNRRVEFKANKPPE